MMFFFSVIFAAAAIAVNIKYFLASVARFDSHLEQKLELTFTVVTLS